MENVFIVPAKDAEGNALVVPDPMGGGRLPAEGAFKPRNQYWIRRLRAGDVTEGVPPTPAPVAPAEPAAPAAAKQPASVPADAADAAPAAPLAPGK